MVKLTKVERDQDAALEIFIHRLVYNKIATYEELFSQLGDKQCLDLRQTKMDFNKEVKK